MQILASDLDNTLIYSHKRMPEGVCVELYEGRPCSYMTPEAHRLLGELAQQMLFVPVTTRSLEQYRRIDFGLGRPPAYAIVANGGILLRDGMPDPAWERETQALVEPAQLALAEAMELLAAHEAVTLGPRHVDGVFVFAKSADVPGTEAMLRAALDERQVFVDRVGEKVYVFPRVLDKGRALRRLRSRLGACFAFAAGDSVYDVPLLLEADCAILPDEAFLQEALAAKAGCHIVAGERHRFGDAVLQHALRGEV